MGHSGFPKVASKSGSQTEDVNLFPDFSLDDDFTNNLIAFLHLEFSLSQATVINIIDDGIVYPLNNGLPLIGKVSRTLGIEKGETFNVQLGTAQTNLKFKMGLEG